MLYNSAADSHLAKLDRVQEAAQRIGRFEVESLASRRNSAIACFALKMLDGKVRPLLQHFTPKLVDEVKSRTRVGGWQIEHVCSTRSLDKFRRSFFGVLPNIWRRIPQKLINTGMRIGWLKNRNQVKKILIDIGNKT